MAQSIGRLTGHFGAALKFFVMKDGQGRPRWGLSVVVLATVGLVIASSFLAGALFRDTPALEKIKTRIKLALAEEVVDPADAWPFISDDRLDLPWRALETNNQSLELAVIPIGTFAGSGGSLFEVGDPVRGEHLAFVTPKGRIGYVAHVERSSDVVIDYLSTRVPMRLEAFESSNIAQMPAFNRNWIRTMDSLVKPLGDNRYALFVSHHRYEDECIAFTISRTELLFDENTLSMAGKPWETLFQASPCMEMKTRGNLYSGLRDGGRLALADQNTLYVTVGDFDMDGDNSIVRAPMDPNYDQGKLLAVDIDTGASRHVAVGMRNAQGLVVTHDGHVFTTEHGPHGGDELNLIEAGGNYGWPEETLGVAYGFPRRDWPHARVQGRHDSIEYISPAHAFVPSIGIGSITEITSASFPDWHGDLLIGSLDNQSLFRVRREGGRVVYVERTHIGERMRDILQLANGEIALLTDSARILLIRPAATPDETSQSPLQVAGYTRVREVAAELAVEMARTPIHPGRVIFEAKCSSCHSITSNEVVAGPPLYRIAGRRIGGVEGYPYSEALTGRGGRWDEASIRLFLSDPNRNFEGTSMPRIALTYPEYLHVAWWIAECTGGKTRPECDTNG
ncbi:MAG: PQQ-dependent sugar dehydrogenase [Pseudomonadota bacterium]